MRTAAELYREWSQALPAGRQGSDRIYRDHVRIHRAEFMFCAELFRLLLFHICTNDGDAFGNLLVHYPFHFRFLFQRHFLSIGEIDAQALARDIAAALMHVLPEHHLERLQKNMMRRVIPNGLFRMIGEPAGEFLRRSCTRKRLMLLHLYLYGFHIQCDAAFFRDLFCELYRKSICSEEHERINVVAHFLYFAHAVSNRKIEFIFFLNDYPLNLSLLRSKIGILNVVYVDKTLNNPT